MIRPHDSGELALAPTTMHELNVAIGDWVHVGFNPGTTARVVGEALLPGTSHTDYDQSGWMTRAGLTRALKQDQDAEDYLLVRWRSGMDVAAARRHLIRLGGRDLFPIPATLPVAAR